MKKYTFPTIQEVAKKLGVKPADLALKMIRKMELGSSYSTAMSEALESYRDYTFFEEEMNQHARWESKPMTKGNFKYWVRKAERYSVNEQRFIEKLVPYLSAYQDDLPRALSLTFDEIKNYDPRKKFGFRKEEAWEKKLRSFSAGQTEQIDDTALSQCFKIY